MLRVVRARAAEDLYESRPHKTRTGFARDWELWREFHDWLAERTGTRLPDSAITVGTYVAFGRWLDEVKQAAPNSIERRVTGVASEARRYGYEVPKAARAAATQALKPLKNDKERQKRGRGKAAAITPADLRKMNTAPRERAPQPDARRRRVLVVPELARLRDRSLHTMRFAVAGRNEEMSELDDTGIRLVAEGLEVHVPSVKGRPARDVVVSYGENVDTCAAGRRALTGGGGKCSGAVRSAVGPLRWSCTSGTAQTLLLMERWSMCTRRWRCCGPQPTPPPALSAGLRSPSGHCSHGPELRVHWASPVSVLQNPSYVYRLEL